MSDIARESKLHRLTEFYDKKDLFRFKDFCYHNNIDEDIGVSYLYGQTIFKYTNNLDRNPMIEEYALRLLYFESKLELTDSTLEAIFCEGNFVDLFKRGSERDANLFVEYINGA